MAKAHKSRSDYPSEEKILIGIFDYLYRRKGQGIPLEEVKNAFPFSDTHQDKIKSNFEHAVLAIEKESSFIKVLKDDNGIKSLILETDPDTTGPVIESMFPCWDKHMHNDVLSKTISEVSSRKHLKNALVKHLSDEKIDSLACCKGGTCFVMAREIFEQVNQPTKLITANLLLICEAMRRGIGLVLPFGTINTQTAYINSDEIVFKDHQATNENMLLSDIYADFRLISFRSVYLDEKNNLCFSGSGGEKDTLMVKACFKPKPEKGDNVIIVIGSEKIAKMMGEKVVSTKSDELFDENITYTMITDINNPDPKNIQKWKVLNKFLEIGDNTSVYTHLETFNEPVSLDFN
ncbi:MAG: hypothetical protein OEV87_10075 [Phycisphaerae bacterium]|nr:hypothetical protein [Phycisphaerae bacterium]